MLIGRTTRVPLRRMAALLAVLAVVGTFVAGATSPVVRAEAVATNFPVHAEFHPNDPYFNCIGQWGVCKIGADSAWDVTLGSRSVVVAVVDTGVWWTHEDLQANMWVNPSDGTSHGYDFIDGDRNPMDNDPSGLYHGTGVAGVIAAITDNNVDIAGVAQVRVMALRSLGSNGQGSSLNTSQAIHWAAQHGAKIINLSLGTNETFGGPTDIQLAIDYAWSQGALVVAAAGNGGISTLDYPARLPNVVSVAAIDETGRKASFSNYGSGLDLAAPGTTIFTLGGGTNSQLHTLQGTSFAAPFVSAAAALLLSVDSNLTNVELWNILNSTAVQPGGGTGYNTNYGWGVVNAWNAINALRQPFISVNAYPASVSRSSTFGVTWSILGDAPIVHRERFDVAVRHRHVLLQGRRDRERDAIRISRVHGRCLEPTGLLVRPVPAPRVEPAVPGPLHPGPCRGRRLHPAATRREGSARGVPIQPVVPDELLRPEPTRVATSAHGHAGSTPGGRPAPTNRVRAARTDPADAFHSHSRRDGDQEALSELRDDCERGQPVLLLLRDPVPLTAAKPDRREDRPRHTSE